MLRYSLRLCRRLRPRRHKTQTFVLRYFCQSGSGALTAPDPARPEPPAVLRTLDIHGRLETIASVSSPFQIECDDWVVIAGQAEHEANLFYNESRPSGNKQQKYRTMLWVLAAVGALAILVGAVVVGLALSRAAHSRGDLLVIGRCAALALAGGLTAWIGLWFATMMVQLARLVRAFHNVLAVQRENSDLLSC